MKLFNGLFCVIIFALGIGANAAAVEIVGVANASNFVAGVTPADMPIIYGATAGEPCVSKLGANEFCNNCTDDKACSQKRIHADLTLRIDFKAVTNGYIAFGIIKNGFYESFAASIFTRSTTGRLETGDLGYVEIKWGTLCKLIPEDDESCMSADMSENLFVALTNDANITIDETAPVTLRIFSPSNDWEDKDEVSCEDEGAGICSADIAAGDQKIFITSIETTGAYPNENNVPLTAMRVFYSDKQGSDLLDINYTNPYVDIALDPMGVPFRNYIDGLTNNIYYGFKIAIVDEAMNVSSMISNFQIGSECVNSTIIDLTANGACPYIAMPTATQPVRQSYP